MARRDGFTLLEVLLATVIFALSIFAISQSRTSSLRNTIESQRLFEASLLAESKMSELELKYQAKVDKDGIEASKNEESGKFDAPNDRYSWKASFKKSEMKFTRDLISGLMQKLGVDETTAINKADDMKLVISNLNKLVENNFGELRLEISWDDYGRNRSFPVVTHLIPTKPKIELTTESSE